MRRLFWRLAYIPLLLANRLIGTSYKWVNVGIGAWHPEYFDALWHWRWYGDPIQQMPEIVNLCGIMHRITVCEGLVVFADNCGMGVGRITFARDPFSPHEMLWYFHSLGRVPACHVIEAYRWVEAVYGGSHELKRPAIKEK